MGRQVRMVPADWVHPVDPKRPVYERTGKVRHLPLMEDGYLEHYAEWEQNSVPEWLEGQRLWYHEGKVKRFGGELQSIEDCIASLEPYRRPEPGQETYECWAGPYPQKPLREHYMPDWPLEQRTHYMMYEDTSEGTPISPAFATPEELARWLADNGASAFGDQTASYEAWLKMIQGSGYSVSAVMMGGRMISGVEADLTLDSE